MNLLIAPFKRGLLGAAFPMTGMPEIPKPQLPQLDAQVRQTIFSLLSPHMQGLPEPQLSQAIMQIFVGQQNRFKAIQGGSIPLLNAAFHQQLQQMQQMQQQQQQQQ